MLYIFLASLIPLITSIADVILALMGTEIAMLKTISDFASIVLMFIGLTKLAKESDKFKLSRTIYIVLLIINIASVVILSSADIDLGFLFMNGAIIVVIGFAQIFLGRYARYLIGQGAIDMEMRRNADMGAQALAKAINIEITLTIGLVVTTVLSTYVYFLSYATTILSFASIIASIYTITRMYKTYKLSEPVLAENAPIEFVDEPEIQEEIAAENFTEPINEPETIEENFDAGDEISGEGDADGDEE